MTESDCDNPKCAYGYDNAAGMDHWVSVTEYDTDSLKQFGYCSRECMIEHQIQQKKV